MIGTDPLDSFEKLAELPGQVKPPTVTKEDIDNLGLEVIHSGYCHAGMCSIGTVWTDGLRRVVITALRVARRYEYRWMILPAC